MQAQHLLFSVLGVEAQALNNAAEWQVCVVGLKWGIFLKIGSKIWIIPIFYGMNCGESAKWEITISINL